MLKMNLALVIALMSNVVVAEEMKPWETEVDLGAITTSGNTNATSIHAKVDAKQHLDRWNNEYIASSLYKNDEAVQPDGTKVKEKTAEKYFGSIKSAYSLSDEKKSYLFGFVSDAHDKFGAYKNYAIAAVGYGNWLYSTPSVNWFAEIGPGYFRGERVIQTGDVNTPYLYEIEQGALLRLASELEWKFTSTATFKQLFSIETGSNNTRSTSETSVAASISNAMQMKVAVTVASDSTVAPGKEKTDTTTSVTLVYKF